MESVCENTTRVCVCYSQWILSGVVVTEDESCHWRPAVWAEVMETTVGGRSVCEEKVV